MSNEFRLLNCYNARGEALCTVDPNGKVGIQEFDEAGRLIKTVENYQPET